MSQRLVGFFTPFEGLTDPRIERTLEHAIFDFVVVALPGTIEIPGSFDTSATGIEEKGCHMYSHHGKAPVLMDGMPVFTYFRLATFVLNGIVTRPCNFN